MPFFHQSSSSKSRRARSLSSLKRSLSSPVPQSEDKIPDVPTIPAQSPVNENNEFDKPLPEVRTPADLDMGPQDSSSIRALSPIADQSTIASSRMTSPMMSPTSLRPPPVPAKASNSNGGVSRSTSASYSNGGERDIAHSIDTVVPRSPVNRERLEPREPLRERTFIRDHPPRTSSKTHQQKSSLDLTGSDESSEHEHRQDEEEDMPRPSYDTVQSRDSVPSFVTDGTSVPDSVSVIDHKGNDVYIPTDEYHAYDLLPPTKAPESYSLEEKSLKLFSNEHFETIVTSPSLLAKFVKFLGSHRPRASMQLLIYYFDALKAIRAIKYANAVAESLEPIPGLSFTDRTEQNLEITQTGNSLLEQRAAEAFQELADQELPRYITWVFTEVITHNIGKKIMGTISPKLRTAAEGLAEVFCLTDPSRPDNPIVFCSEEFNRTTQYGIDYIVDRNCRFLQGPQTNKHSVKRIRDAIHAGREISEVFLNYRRDGSPFMNLLMVAPLCDSRGNVRYFIGAQVDVTQLVRDAVGLESFKRLEAKEANDGKPLEIEQQSMYSKSYDGPRGDEKNEFDQLAELFSPKEIEAVKAHGGRIHKDHDAVSKKGFPPRQRVVIKPSSPSREESEDRVLSPYASATLRGVYRNYLLIRPYPSLRILFASPALRVPGVSQSPFMSRIGGSQRVRDEIESALMEGRGCTAKVRWMNRKDDVETGPNAGRDRWIHATPLLGANGSVGVWMIVVVDDDTPRPGAGARSSARKYRDAPVIASHPEAWRESAADGQD